MTAAFLRSSLARLPASPRRLPAQRSTAPGSVCNRFRPRKSTASLNFAMRSASVALLAAALLLAQVAAAVEEQQLQPPLLRTADAQQDSEARAAAQWTQDEVAGVLLAALAVFVAAGGGTGGGGVLDPIYILIMGLDPKVRLITARTPGTCGNRDNARAGARPMSGI